VNEAEHRKQMLIQKITHHREHMCLELEVLRDASPALPIIKGTRQVLGVLGILGPGGGTGSGSPRPQDNLELAGRLLPTLLRVLRALLDRREEKRAREESS
jgi:hypothetical protein